MKDFSGISPATLPPTDDPMFVPRVRSMLNDVDIYLREVARGFSRIQQGQVPDGSGDSLSETPGLDLSQYAYLPGRSGGQTLHGGTQSTDQLTLRGHNNDTQDASVAEVRIHSRSATASALVESLVLELAGGTRVWTLNAGGGILAESPTTSSAGEVLLDLRPNTTTGSNSTIVVTNNNTGLTQFRVSPSGGGFMEVGNGAFIARKTPGVGTSPTTTIDLTVAGNFVGQLIKANASQSNNLLEFRSSASALLSRVTSAGVWDGPISTTGSTIFTDSTFRIQDNADNSKLLAFELGGFTTATTRTLTPPNADTTIAGLGVAQTFTKAQTITPDSDASPLYILGTNVASANLFQIDASGGVTAMTVDFAGVINFATAFTVWSGSIGATNSVIFDASAVTGPTQITIPTIDGTLVITAGTQTITGSKTFSGTTTISGLGSVLRSSTATSGVRFADNTDTSKALRAVLSGCSTGADNSLTFVSTADRNYGFQNLSGNVPVVGDDAPAVASGALGKVDLTGQGGDITSTALSNTPPAGLYQVDAYLVCTTAGTGAGTLALNLAWTDVLGATSENIVNLFSISATGRTAASKTVQLSSGNISYSVTATGGYGAAPAAAYAVYIRVTALG